MHFVKFRAAATFASSILALFLSAPGAFAQQSNATPAQAPSDDNSFPADVSRKAAVDKKKADQSPPDTPSANPSATSSGDNAGQTKPPADPGTDDNAFPEDASRKAADAAKTESSGTTADAPSNPGVSSSGDYDRRTAGRNTVPTNVPMPHANGKDPLKDDINVGGYYLESGNFAGAYLRFKEASTLAPENSDAMFGLAEAARHLKRREEALANYQLFLQIVDSGSKAKDARKAVASLEKTK